MRKIKYEKFKLRFLRRKRTNGGAPIRFDINDKKMQKMNIPNEYITKTEDFADQVTKNRINLFCQFSHNIHASKLNFDAIELIFGFASNWQKYNRKILCNIKIWKRKPIGVFRSCSLQVFILGERDDYELSTSSFRMYFGFVTKT